MRPTIDRLIVAGLAFLALLPGLGGRGEAQVVDPQALIGEWQGTWAATAIKGMTGQFNMTIKTVEGNKVQGRVERSNLRPGVTPDFNFTGTLAGNVLKFQAGAANTELTIDGIRMSGQMFGNTRMDISLTKKK